VTSSAQGIHDLDLLRRGGPAGLHVEFFDVTSSYAVLSVMGPRSRALLDGLSSSDFGAASFPFGHSRAVDLSGLTVRATRLTYVLEKGYRAFGRELGPDTSPVEAGLGFTCKLGTAIPFRGRAAVEKHKAQGVSRRLVSLVISDPAAYAWGGELLLRDDEPAGFASSAAFGHTLGRTVLLGYVERRDGGVADRAWISQGTYHVAIGGERYEASVSLKPPYDPAGMRIRA